MQTSLKASAAKKMATEETAARAASGYIFNDSSLGLAVGGGSGGGNTSTTDWSYISNSVAGG